MLSKYYEPFAQRLERADFLGFAQFRLVHGIYINHELFVWIALLLALYFC